MSDVIRTILIMSISGSILALLLFMLKPLMRNRLPKSAQYYLWIVVIAALLVPVSTFVKLPIAPDNITIISPPSSVVDRYIITSEEEMTRLNSGIPMQSEVDDAEYMQIVKQATSPIAVVVDVFTLIYPFGVLVVLFYYIISFALYMKFHRRRNRAANAEELAVLVDLCKNRRAPQLYRNPIAATPMLLGIFRPAIILPDREYTESQLRAVLLHELTHLRRKDITVKWLSLLACAVHWFNPVVWLVRREIDRACELSCDEAVIRNLDEEGKQNYGDTLLYVATDSKTPKAFISTTMCEEKKALKERLGAIMKSKKYTRVTVIVSVMLIFAAIGTTMALGAGKEVPLKEPPNITIKVGATEIAWYVGLNKWNGNVYDRLDGFHVIMSHTTFEELQYIKNNSQIIITFDGVDPDKVTLTEYILRENGDEKYNIIGMEYDVQHNAVSSKFNLLAKKDFVFTIKPNYSTAASSNIMDYLPGNTLKGYRLICNWGANECEYSFIIRGDAVMEMESSADTVTIIIYQDGDGKTGYSLFDGDVIPAPSEFSRGKVFHDVAELNAALAEYAQDILRLMHIKHTMDFTKDEMQIINDMIKVPSDNYSKAVGLYEFHITTLDEAREIVRSHYPNALESRYPDEDIISYTNNPPVPVEVYSFEIEADGVAIICAVSKERGIFFTYNNGEWGAFTGMKEWSGATKNITLDDIRAIAQKIGTNLTMGDLRDFIGMDIGSGLYVMQYFIEDSDYMLIVGSGDMNTVMYANLIHATDGGANESIDIRYYDVDKFIKNETKELVRPLPESQPK